MPGLWKTSHHAAGRLPKEVCRPCAPDWDSPTRTLIRRHSITGRAGSPAPPFQIFALPPLSSDQATRG